jgi:hypothetical protein
VSVSVCECVNMSVCVSVCVCVHAARHCVIITPLYFYRRNGEHTDLDTTVADV